MNGRRTGGHAGAQPSSGLRDAMVTSIPNLRAFATSLCRDGTKADDLVQETLLKAWANFETFEEGTNLKAWLFTILRNTYFSERRKQVREVQDVDNTYSERLFVMPEQQGCMDLGDFVIALHQLPSEQREALMLVGAEGFTYEEAARISDCQVGTIKSRVNRARARLADILQLTRSTDLATDPIEEAVVNLASAGQRRS